MLNCIVDCICRFLVIAMVLSFIWIVLMRWIAGVMVWLSVALFVVFFSYGSYITSYIISIIKPFIFISAYRLPLTGS